MEGRDTEPAGEHEQSTSGYPGETAASPTPTAASAVPPGISQSASRRSDQNPKSGWTTEDESVAASSSSAANA